MVEIKSSEYQDFTCDSIVDCNIVFVKSIDVIIDKLSNGQLKQKANMDISIVQKLKRAAIYSNRVERNIKEKLKGS